ncbi:MAG TPA: molecular chaperone DnaJ [Streptosporangiaceae bacterium]
MTARTNAPRVTGHLTTLEAIELIEAADGPADLFGSDAARCYRRLARLTHPDARPGDARAAAAFARLADLWGRHSQAIGPLVASGDVANLYQTGAGLLKLARNPADNDLMDREAAALRALASRVPARLAAYFPRLIDAKRVQDPLTGTERRGNLLGSLDGFVSLARVRRLLPGGVDPRDAAWMWRRLLVALGAAHRAGVSHGAVLPEHVLIHPAEHGLVLADWCYSGRCCQDMPLPAVVARYRHWYPPDVLSRQPAGPGEDIWLATRCMTDLTGARLPAPLAAFARGCQLANPGRRPPDAWQLLAELDDLLERLYGPRTFRPFVIPA